MMRSAPKLKSNSMMAAVALLGRDGPAHESSYHQIQARTDHHSLPVPSGSMTTDHRACLGTHLKDPLNTHSSDTPGILFL